MAKDVVKVGMPTLKFNYSIGSIYRNYEDIWKSQAKY